MNTLYSIDEINTDDCTYSCNNTIFVTNDTTSLKVFNKLKDLYDITEDQFIELVCFNTVYVNNTQLEINIIEII